ncbi:hypothetical protein HMPREF9624_01814 [Oribacterium asaccharolyticum ACB7]|uniref:histidine kinase n=1 Tax=Oribacterium asaccharolyticum ACB7 TaxID=796944 RepID=G9WRU8_9FIRM|nr:sensor histidine kinase [Oribacterium asaccharolyticum]EHL14038.1 hypothetical protein HMPREF9624_01814 [Oribacterium asaccharolyticum ACB7]
MKGIASFRRYFQNSFRRRLFGAFLLCSLIPLLLSLLVLFSAFRGSRKEQVDKEGRESLKLIRESIIEARDSITLALQELSESVELKRALTEERKERTEVNRLLFSLTEGLRDTVRFDIYDKEGNLRYSTAPYLESRSLPTDWGILQRATRADSPVYESSEGSDSRSRLFQIAVRIKGQREGGDKEISGYVLASLEEEAFRTLLSGKYGVQNGILLLSSYWRPVYSENILLPTELFSTLREEFLRGNPLEDSTGEFIYTVTPIEDMGLYLILRQEKPISKNMNFLMLLLLFLSILFGAALSFLMGSMMSRRLFTPIERLRSAMREVTLDHLDVRLRESEDELGELAGRFNRMTEALAENRRALLLNQETLLKNQKELNEAQIRMLQAQLNPHFLGNTLDAMKWMGKIHQIPEVAEMATDLADILRFAISPKEFVSLEMEIEILKRYMEIQKIRGFSKIEFHLTVPENLQNAMVPRMVLQPLVENAILHGILSEGEIELCAAEQDNELRILVKDNGKGIRKELIGPYSPPKEDLGHHLGLYNVDTILKKHYGERYGLTILDRKEEEGVCGTIVLAVLPLQRERLEG